MDEHGAVARQVRRAFSRLPRHCAPLYVRTVRFSTTIPDLILLRLDAQVPYQPKVPSPQRPQSLGDWGRRFLDIRADNVI